MKPDEVQRVFAGQVILGGAGQNPARQAAVGAGIPLTVPGDDHQHRLPLRAWRPWPPGADLIEKGDADIVVALGQESMSLAPHAMIGSRTGKKYGAMELVDLLDHDGLVDSFEHISMGASTERGNGGLGIDRAAQDAVAAASHQNAAKSRDFLAGEIEPYPVASRKGDVAGRRGRRRAPRHHRRHPRGAEARVREGERHDHGRATRRRSPTAPRPSC